ncbi:MAG: DUF4394 domain-containing protein [Rhizobiales bacterium]|nr:DUF4394 domain-containing protein [Hyphomicrobiales bacterium]
MNIVKTVLVASTALMAAASTGFAASVLGLAGDKTLVMFDTETGTVSSTMEVTGVNRLAGIDFRPANNTVIGVTPESVIVTIDLKTGAATELSRMNTPLAIGEAPVIVDFNPMADRLRYMTATTNHRVNADTGEVTVDGSLAYKEGDMHKGETPNIVAAAYINSYGKPEATAMYNIDATIGALISQKPPNEGTLSAIGKLGIENAGPDYAFDVHATKDGVNTAWLVNGNKMYAVDLKTGAASEAGAITGFEGAIRDIAILPAM